MNNYMKMIFCAFFFSMNLSAQVTNWYEKNLSAYTEFLKKGFGIETKTPDGFTDLNQYYVGWMAHYNRSGGSGNIYGPMFMSPEKDCIIMYLARPMYSSKEDIERAKICFLMERVGNRDTTTSEPKFEDNNSMYPRAQIMAELRNALGLFISPVSRNDDTTRVDFDDYVTIISGKRARDMFNADSVYLYDLPHADSVYFFDESLEKMRKGKYPYCSGMFTYKRNRATMDVKFFFTEEGKKKQDEYIRLMGKHIWYDERFKQE
ncbi:hypothetical protein [Tannerella forsythia]